MPQIESEEAAHRLARAIVADIKLYNSDAIDAGADLTRELGEGRELFQSRVMGRLHPLYEAALADAGLATAGTLAPVEREALGPLPNGLFESRTPSAAAAPVRWPLVLLALVVALAIGWWLATH